VVTRRAFIGTVAGTLLVAPLAVGAQQAGKVYRLGILGASQTTVSRRWLDAFFQELHKRGWIVGESVVVERRFVEPGSPKLANMAEDLVGLGVDAILATSTEAAVAARKSTRTIPIIAANLGDPVRSGLVASLARPGGNVTGTSIVATEVTAKQIQLLKEAVPRLSRMGVLWNPDNPSHPSRVKEAAAAGEAVTVRVDRMKARTPDDLEQAIPAAAKRGVNGLLVLADPQFGILSGQIARLATANSLPVMYGQAEHVEEDGGLMSYGASFVDLYRRTAVLMDRVLRGAAPADLPVEQATKFELVINLKTAKALGLTIPQSLLQRADQVIE